MKPGTKTETKTAKKPAAHDHYQSALTDALAAGKRAAERADEDAQKSACHRLGFWPPAELTEDQRHRINFELDGGTCNFDDVFLVADHRKLRGERVAAAITAAGLPVHASTWRLFGKARKGFFVAHTFGQANRRTVMMGAFLKAARAATPEGAPWEFLGYYQAD